MDIPPGDGGDAGAADTPPPKAYQFEQVLHLQDFPQTVDDVKALVALGFTQLNGVFLVEEAFNRDIEDEEDDDITVSTLPPRTEIVPAGEEAKVDEAANAGAEEGEKKAPEKLKNKLSERVRVFENVVGINRLLKKQPIGSAARNCIVERIRFEGPADPMDIPTPPEDGSEPEPIDEEQKAKEFKFYDDFAAKQRGSVEEMARDLQEYRETKAVYGQNLKPLWAAPVDLEEEKRRLERAELRRSQLALRAQEEADRAAAEAAATKGKKAPEKKAAGRASVTSDPAAEGDAAQAEAPEAEEPPFASQDDDPAKSFEFFEFKKIMSELPSGKATVGTMLGAMVL